MFDKSVFFISQMLKKWEFLFNTFHFPRNYHKVAGGKMAATSERLEQSISDQYVFYYQIKRVINTQIMIQVI